MKKNESVVFDQYDLRLREHDYHVIVPRRPPKEGYINPYTETPLLDGNHELYKTLRAICVALIRNPELIAYLPFRKNGTLHDKWNDSIFPAHDMVIYRENVQLNRHSFQQVKRMFQYRKPRQLTIRYSVDGFLDYCDKYMGAYLQSHPYYYDGAWKLYESDSTFFTEGNPLLLCDSYIEIACFTDGINLEAKVREDLSSPICFAFGYEMGYITKNIRKYITRHRKRSFS